MSLSLKNRRQVNTPLEITLGGKAVLPEQQSGNPCRTTAVLLPDRVCLQVQECQIWWDQRPSIIPRCAFEVGATSKKAIW